MRAKPRDGSMLSKASANLLCCLCRLLSSLQAGVPATADNSLQCPAETQEAERKRIEAQGIADFQKIVSQARPVHHAQSVAIAVNSASSGHSSYVVYAGIVQVTRATTQCCVCDRGSARSCWSGRA